MADLLGPDLCARLDRLDLLSRRIFGGKLPGERRAKARGQSVEFDDYREYVGGDDLRHIDWNVMARLDRLTVKLFREDKDLSLHLAVDTSASMLAGDPPKLLLALRLAMALAYIGLVNRNRVSLATFGGDGQRLRPMRGRRSIARAAAFLLKAWDTAAGGRGVAGGEQTLFRAVRGLTRQGRGVAVIISDFLMDEAPGPALNLLAGIGGYECTCLQVLSPAELDPEREGRLRGDVRLTDAESPGAIDLTISPRVARAFGRGMRAHIAGLRTACASRGIGHAVVPSDTDVAEIVLRALRGRGVLG